MLTMPENIDVLVNDGKPDEPWLKFNKTEEQWTEMIDKCQEFMKSEGFGQIDMD